ncbi:MAG: dockerin type I repeat-containing protein [Ruminococcus sp.]|nr:dockerin type I repeat-containing protein [Ruminococcus sp.]
MTFNKKTGKVFAAALAVAMIAATSASLIANAEETVKLGDVNGDTRVNVLDATIIQKVTAKLIEAPENYEKAGDVNGDKTVNVKDATLIQKYTAKIIDKFPAEEGGAIVDETTVPETEETGATTATEPKPSEGTTPAETTETVKPTETTVKPVEPTTAAVEPTTAPSTQPSTDEEGWEHKIYQP